MIRSLGITGVPTGSTRPSSAAAPDQTRTTYVNGSPSHTTTTSGTWSSSIRAMLTSLPQRVSPVGTRTSGSYPPSRTCVQISTLPGPGGSDPSPSFVPDDDDPGGEGGEGAGVVEVVDGDTHPNQRISMTSR